MKQIIKLTAIIAFYGLVFFSCDKDDNKPIDFRDKHIGNYQVRETINSYGPPEFDCGEPYSRERDTVITVSYGDTDTTLNVLGRDVWLDSTGRYYDYRYELRIWNDSIISLFMNGGLACGQFEIYKGYRISSKP